MHGLFSNPHSQDIQRSGFGFLQRVSWILSPPPTVGTQKESLFKKQQRHGVADVVGWKRRYYNTRIAGDGTRGGGSVVEVEVELELELGLGLGLGVQVEVEVEVVVVGVLEVAAVAVAVTVSAPLLRLLLLPLNLARLLEPQNTPPRIPGHPWTLADPLTDKQQKEK